MEKAEYLGACSVNWQHTDLFYEYRGYEYCVTKHNNGYIDKSLREQHEEEACCDCLLQSVCNRCFIGIPDEWPDLEGGGEE